jgi:beta-lactamase regulating signal transducer with metallopeptidase domain
MDSVLNWLWQGCVVAVACGVMLRVLDRARANVRYVVCWTALLLIVALPGLPSLQSSAAALDAVGTVPDRPIVSLPVAWWTSALAMLALWIAWASVHVVRFVAAIAAIRRARARSRACPSQVESLLPHWCRVRSTGRRATLVLSDSVTTAAVLSGGTPTIAVAPSLVRSLDPGELDRVLIHEWAHVQRRDDLVQIVQIVVRLIAGWHPALWWIDRRLHIEREIACDEMTIAIAGSPRFYAACLMKVASVTGKPHAMLTAPAILTPSSLSARVMKILSPHPSIAPLWARSLATAIVAALWMMSVGLGGLKMVEATTFASAFESIAPRTISPTGSTIAPVAAPPQPNSPQKKRPRRQSSSPSSSPSSLPSPEPEAPSAPPAVNVPDPTLSAADGEKPVVMPETSTVIPPPAAPSSSVSAEQPRSPWSAVADGGTALGRKSKDAGVATAGFFTRFGRRVAGSF